MSASPSYAAQAKAALEARAVFHLDVTTTGTGWNLVMQSGVLVACTTGIPLMALLRGELMLPEDALATIDVLLLDGKPLDSPETTPVPNGSRIALAAGLPGIAGLAMKSDSAVKGLRPGITHSGGEALVPGPGSIELALFSLALPLLAPHALGRGVLIEAGRLTPYLRPALQGDCLLDGAPVSIDEARARLTAASSGTLALLTVSV